MSLGTISAEVLASLEVASEEGGEQERSSPKSLQPISVWNSEKFAQEQLRGLVRRVFLSSALIPVRQVVFSATEPETDVRSICRSVGEILAAEVAGTVAVAWRLTEDPSQQFRAEGTEIRTRYLPRIATQLRTNLWLLPRRTTNAESVTAASVHQYLGNLRREFEYSVVAARSAGESGEAMEMADFADGIVLVLSAQRTRRATALKIKEALEGTRARLIGTILSDRIFPIPNAIYRRL